MKKKSKQIYEKESISPVVDYDYWGFDWNLKTINFNITSLQFNHMFCGISINFVYMESKNNF